MKKKIYLLLASIAIIQADEELQSINISETIEKKIVKKLNSQEIKSSDLAETLNNKIPSISLIRRSGIANDITLRGQKRDNINITIDGGKICGACVNRMDPPSSHIVTHLINEIEVSEGPFDVEEFGVLSGSIKIKTKKPSQEISGNINISQGSFDHKKISGTVSGGTKKIRMLLSTSDEKGKQYKDGNSNNFSEQLREYTNNTSSTKDNDFNYYKSYKNMNAFEKKTYVGKVFIEIMKEQILQLNYTKNESLNVLYPSSKMDASYDDSTLFNAQYMVKNLSRYSKEFNLKFYHSKVEHPMSTKYRLLSNKTNKYMTHSLSTNMQGLKVKNRTDTSNGIVTYGFDASKRNWNGEYSIHSLRNDLLIEKIGTSLANVDTNNRAIFFKSQHNHKKIHLELGLRYDDTKITTQSLKENNNNYQTLSGNIFTIYQANESTKYFFGLGKSSRVPDARELYNIKYKIEKDKKPQRVLNGNPNLKQTDNYEMDLGIEKNYEQGDIKVKTFYSKLKNYIYYNGNSKIKKNNFENIDATIYGTEISGDYFLSDNLTFEGGISYKKGKKNTQPSNQKNKNLAEMRPLKVNASLIYDYNLQGNVELSTIATSAWKNIDSENGEQQLAGYGIINLKNTHEFDNGFILTMGIDNLTNKTYASTNTYKDLILMSDGSDTMLINEAGRSFYLNAGYKF